MEKSGKHYKQLNAEERATIMLMKREGSGLKEIERFLKRSPRTISNEIHGIWGVNLATVHPWLAKRHTVCESSPVNIEARGRESVV